MTLQQLEYILAVDKHRHFIKAAESCGITQSTLSTLIRKLEEELDIIIFDRNSHPVKPTLAGEQIINQAKVVLFHSRQLQEMSLSERKKASGHIRMGVTPTIAPYIIPKLFHYIDEIPEVTMQASELHRPQLIRQLKEADLDMVIMSLPHKEDGLLEIPLYEEKFYAYVSPDDELWKEESICSETLNRENMWALKNEICFQKQVSGFCDQESERTSRYESGNIATLLHIVNENKGFTVVPELHLPMLRPEHLKNIRPLVNPVPIREVSLFLRSDYVRESLINIIVKGIKTIIPQEMLNERIVKYQVRL